MTDEFEIIACQQAQCTFQKGTPNEDMCPICSCGMKPHIISESCDDCNDCMRSPNYIRGKKGKGIEVSIANQIAEEQQAVIEITQIDSNNNRKTLIKNI